MSRKQLKTADGEGFLRAYWDLVGDMHKEYGVDCKFRVMSSSRRGVLVFTLAAQSLQADARAPVVASYTAEFPNASVGSLEAFLYRCAFKLDYMLEQKLRYPSGKAR